MIGTSTTSLVACNKPQYTEDELKKEKHKINTLVNKENTFFYKSEIWNNKIYISGLENYKNNKLYELDLNDSNKELTEIKGINYAVWSLLAVNDKLYIGTNNGLYVMELNNPNKKIIEAGLKNWWVDSLLAVNDKLYIGTNNGLYVMELNNSTNQLKKINSIINRIETFYFNKDNLYIGLKTDDDNEEGKILKLNTKNNKTTDFKKYNKFNKILDTVYILYINDDKLYFHTRKGWHSGRKEGKIYELDLNDSNKELTEIKGINYAVWSLLAVNDNFILEQIMVYM